MALPIFVVGGLVDYPASLVVKMQENLVRNVRVVNNWTLFELGTISILHSATMMMVRIQPMKSRVHNKIRLMVNIISFSSN